MKKILFVFLFVSYAMLGNLVAQTYVNVGVPSTWYDPGGTGVYGTNANYRYTFTPAANNCVKIAFSSFNTELNYDYLYMNSAVGGTGGTAYHGTAIPPAQYGGCGSVYYARFTSDGSVQYDGWVATVSNVPCSSAPTSITASQSVCGATTVTLSASGGASGDGVMTWYAGSCNSAAIGTGSSITVTPSSTTTYYVNYANTRCGGTTGCISTTVTVYTASSTGTLSTAGPVNFCSSDGTFSPAVSISGYNGTPVYQWGSNNGVWNAWGSGASSGVCCFPKQVSNSDGTPDRIRFAVTNGVCPAAYSNTVLIRDLWNEAPSSLTTNINNVCSGTSGTLTATFPTTINLRGTVKFYSGSCGGTLIATVTPTGGTTASTSFTAPGSTTNYYALYDPGTGSGCSVTSCASTTVTIINNSAGAPSSTPTLCINTALTNITHSTTGASGITNNAVPGANGLPAGVAASWASNTITISGTPSASGTFNYSIPLTGGCGSVNATGTIYVTVANTVGAASSTPTLCINTALSPSVTHSTTGATGIGSATGLPSGVTASWASNTITISGTPTASGTYNYSIPLTGGCGSVNATGTIYVTVANTVGAASSTPTLCVNTALTNITHTTSGASGISNNAVPGANGLPAGVAASWSANLITIYGTPTASGTFNYSIPLTGGCGSVSATGTIYVTANMSAGAASSSPSICVNSALTSITHSTTLATGIGSATGLPSGVSAAWASNTITISGTPTNTGTFNYTIPLSGGCGSVNATGTITVNGCNPSITLGSSPSVCQGSTSANLPYTATSQSPDQYSIDYDVTAEGQGFVDVSLTTLPSSPIPLVVPSGATAGAYNATITVKNSSTGYSSTPVGFTVTLIALPSVSISGSSSICVGNTTNVLPSSAGTWASSNNGIATVNSSGVVSGVSAGTATFTYTQTSTGCSNTTSAVTVNAIPSAPTGTTPQTFCNTGTIAGLVATGTSIQWYAASTGGSPLGTGTALVNGTHYYASQTINGCESSTRLNVTVAITAPSAPSGTSSQFFCVTNSPMVTNLAATGSNIQWYAASSGGSALSSSTSLVDGTHYYASQTVNSCESATRFDVTVTVYEVPTVDLGDNPGVCSGSTSATLPMNGSSGNPIKYSIDYDATANSAGFIDVNNATVPLIDFNLVVPAGAAVGTYNGTLTVQNSSNGSGCYSSGYPISVTINPTASVTFATTTLYPLSGATSADLSYSSTTGSPDVYSIDFNVAANTAGFIDLADVNLPSSPIVIDIPVGAPNTTYYATLRVKNSVSGCISAAYPITIVLPVQWTGTVSANWSSAGNWSSNAVPASVNNIEILSSATNMPHITTALTSPTVCNNLSIFNGAVVTVDAGKALTVNGDMLVEGPEALVVKASSTENGSLITLGNITYNYSGSVKIEKYVSSGTVSHWEYLSSPVAAASSSIFTTALRGLWWVNEANNAWVSIPNSTPAAMIALKGYARNYVASEGDGNVIKNYTGAVNTGSQSISLTRTESAPGGKHGWNLTGNPYPNAIDWNASSGWTKTNLNNAIYYRFDGNIRAYVDGVGTGSTHASGIIPAMTSFWVRVDSLQSSGTLACNNSVRVHNTTPASVTPDNTLHLTVVNNSSPLSDDAYVRFKNYASDGFDGQYDAYKMYAADASIPQLFTRIQGADDISINTLGTLSGSKTIPLGFKTTVAGTFTITADMVSSLTSNGNYVYLRDLDAGITQNLAANNTYVFTSGVTNGLKRFVLLFNPPITVFPTIALNSNSFTVAAGTTSIDLAYSGTNNNPDKYSIDFEAAANTAGFVDVTDAGLPTSPMTISIPSTVSPGIYHGTLTVKISSTGATSVNYPITIEVQPVFTTSQDIGTTLQLSWTPTTGVSSYTVQYRIPAGVWVGATAGSSNQIKLTNLTPESDYECKVTTYKNGASYVSQVGTLTTAVTSYNKNQDIGTTLEVSWPALAWASNFTFQYRKTGTTTWTGIPSTTNLVKISNLLPETEYECRVYVYKNNALWGIQQIGTFTTDKVDFVASSITTTSLTLTWNSFAPWATSYTLQYRLPAGVWMTKTTSSPTVALSNLVPASSYECRTYVYKSTLWGISQTGTFATAGGKAISDDNAGDDNQLSVYPNPFTEQMNMDVFVKENTKIIWNLYDMTGKLVLNGQESITAGYSSINIEAADLPKGVYMIKANLNDQVQSFRVMKQ